MDEDDARSKRRGTRDRGCHTAVQQSDAEMGALHETFAAALRSARVASGWSQADLADRIGLSVEAYGRLERGRVLPRASTLVRLARTLHVGVDDLLGLRADSPDGDDLRLRALIGRLRDATPEDLRFLLGVLNELLRWRADAQRRA